MLNRCGWSKGDTRFSGTWSASFSRETRFCKRTEIASKYELPIVRLFSITPELKLPVPVGYWGNRETSCATVVVVPAGVPLVIKPEKGFGTVAVRLLITG